MGLVRKHSILKLHSVSTLKIGQITEVQRFELAGVAEATGVKIGGLSRSRASIYELMNLSAEDPI